MRSEGEEQRSDTRYIAEESVWSEVQVLRDICDHISLRDSRRLSAHALAASDEHCAHLALRYVLYGVMLSRCVRV